jgi:hypothetical protein
MDVKEMAEGEDPHWVGGATDGVRDLERAAQIMSERARDTARSDDDIGMDRAAVARTPHCRGSQRCLSGRVPSDRRSGAVCVSLSAAADESRRVPSVGNRDCCSISASDTRGSSEVLCWMATARRRPSLDHVLTVSTGPQARGYDCDGDRNQTDTKHLVARQAVDVRL